MALIKKLFYVDKNPKIVTEVIGDYCFNNDFFQIRTYKKGDFEKKEASKQNLQIDRKMAKELYELLGKFLGKENK